MKAIETRELTKVFQEKTAAVAGLDLEVERGEIFGFLGPNGAGKTTTIRLLNGTLTPTEGRSSVMGVPSSHNDVRQKTSTLAELARMYENITVYENLKFFASLYDLTKAETESRIQALLTAMELWEQKDRKLGTFSSGMKQKVHLSRVLLNRPEVLFLDEPTSGLDPDAAGQTIRLIRRLARERETTIFLCTHNLPLADQICDSFGFLRKGRLVASGGKEEIIRSLDVTPSVRIETLENIHELAYEDPREINSLVKKILQSGEHIRAVQPVVPTLEDAYFHIIGRSNGEAP